MSQGPKVSCLHLQSVICFWVLKDLLVSSISYMSLGSKGVLFVSSISYMSLGSNGSACIFNQLSVSGLLSELLVS